jgi:protein tyrosine/serine phosphatase
MKNLLLISLMALSTFTYAADPVDNFFKVTDGIYRGARPTTDQAIMDLQTQVGIRNIINLQGGDYNTIFRPIIKYLEPGELPAAIAHEKEVSLKLGIGFLHTELSAVNPIDVDEDSALNVALEFMHDKANQPVFVHCEHGKDRTGLLIALYKVKYENVDVEVAHTEWITKGHTANSQIFTGDLDDYYYQKVEEIKGIKFSLDDLQDELEVAL